jgi:hypothetical protein
MRKIGLYVKKIGNKFCRLTRIGLAEFRYARVIVKVNMKHGRRVIVSKLESLSDRVRAHHGPDPLVT